MIVSVHLRRYDGESDREPRFDTYAVGVPPGAEWTAMDVLDHVRRHLDGGISYFRHSACNRGICRRCTARINGKVSLLCGHLLAGEEVLTIEPVSENRVIKDLVSIDREERPRESF